MMANELVRLLDAKRLSMFWNFIVERQNIYWRRKEGKPRPWSKNHVLDKHFFCNVYRELDRGTQYVITNILQSRNFALPDTVFRVMVYRMFNEPRTYEFLKKPMDNAWFNGRVAGKILDQKHDAGIRIFRGAWMTSGANITGSKAAAYCMELERISHYRKQLCQELREASRDQKGMENSWNVIKSVKWFGSFSAYQVVLDLSYMPYFKKQWHDYDTWVYPGPGAKLGLMWLCGKSPAKRSGSGAGKFLKESEYAKLIYHLRDKQDSYFKKYKLKFRRWEDKPLDLHNIEFSLCEFNKYMRAHHGGLKKAFIPYEENKNLGG